MSTPKIDPKKCRVKCADPLISQIPRPKYRENHQKTTFSIRWVQLSTKNAQIKKAPRRALCVQIEKDRSESVLDA
ncbi:hypothetical protein, partial [Aquabacterium sp.]|uniref:hypothetical protein n=1 Tax=Aquabacterium sp. TaxID=1872578 RepID=UPI0025BF8431